jgi:peptidoglycan/xylan/chitin deacetylase (PgdA/CDA1 family)
MKRAYCVVLAAAVWGGGELGYSRTVDYPYEIGVWPGFRAAAISYTCDDDCANQLRVAVPMFNEFGFKLTLFTITGESPDWAGLQQAAARGHEIASHSVTHPRLSDISLDQQRTELKNSQEVIDAHIPGQKCLTIAYPYCATANEGLCAQYYIAARGCQGFIENSTPADFMNVSALLCGAEGSVQSAADFNARCDAAVNAEGWGLFLLHGIDNDGGYSPLSSGALRGSLQYLDAHRDTFWVETFGNVARYIRERNTATITSLAEDSAGLALLVTDTLDDAIYNVPVSLRRPLPAGWTAAVVTQKGRGVASAIVTVDSGRYVQFDVVPDGGEVILSPSGATPSAPAVTAGQTPVTSGSSHNVTIDLARSYLPDWMTSSNDSQTSSTPSAATGSGSSDVTTIFDQIYQNIITAFSATSNKPTSVNSVLSRVRNNTSTTGPGQ